MCVVVIYPYERARKMFLYYAYSRHTSSYDSYAEYSAALPAVIYYEQNGATTCAHNQYLNPLENNAEKHGFPEAQILLQ